MSTTLRLVFWYAVRPFFVWLWRATIPAAVVALLLGLNGEAGTVMLLYCAGMLTIVDGAVFLVQSIERVDATAD